MSYRDSKIYKLAQEFLYGSLQYSGVNAIFRYFNKHKLLVLTYHDVLTAGFDTDNPVYGMAVPIPAFECQMEFIANHYHVVPLTAVMNWLSGEEELPERPALITFDDGHRNNLINAVPILLRLGLTAAFFVPTEFIGKCLPTWIEDVYLRIIYSEQEAIEFCDNSVHSLQGLLNKSHACGAFFDLCRRLDEGKIIRQIQDVRSALNLPVDVCRDKERFEFLSAQDISLLVKQGFFVGSHSLTHPILSTLSEERAVAEIANSRNALTKYIGQSPLAFAYPFGDRHSDYLERDAELVKTNGYSMGFSGNAGLVGLTDDAFNLARVGIGAKCTTAQFHAQISGSIGYIKSILKN